MLADPVVPVSETGLFSKGALNEFIDKVVTKTLEEALLTVASFVVP